MARLGKPPDVQDKYRYMEFVDQHGRNWGATIELKTGEPSGPIDPKFKAPIMPPPRFLKTNSRKRHGYIHVDYDGWLGMLRQAWDHWRKELLDTATTMYGDAAAQKMEERPLAPALAAKVGRSPEPLEPVLACQHGDKWVLGLTSERPAWADLFFPKSMEKKPTDLPAELAFLNHGQSAKASIDQPESQPTYVKAAGRGKSVWKLPDGSEFTGTKAEAIAAQGVLATSVSVGSVGGVHPSWGG